MYDIEKLYELLEVKLNNISDNILLSKANEKANILLDIQLVIEKVFIHSAMKLSNNNISKASKLLGINRNTLSKKLNELNLKSEF